MATALHAGRTRRTRGMPSKQIRAHVRQDLKEHADQMARERGISISLYLEELLAADAAAKLKERVTG